MIGSTPAVQRYNKRVLALSLVYTVLLLGSVWLFKHRAPAGALAWPVAVLPALPIVAIIAALGRYLVEERDEYLRALAARQSLIATGFTLSLATIWGFLEDAGLTPHLPAYYAAIVWFLGLSVGAVTNRWIERGSLA